MDDPSAPPVNLPLEALQYIRLSGRVGGGLPDDRYVPFMSGDPLKIPLPGTAGFSSGLARPAYFDVDSEGRVYPLLVSNEAIAVVVGAPHSLDIFNRKTSEWHRISIPFASYRVRAFGPWVGAIAEEPGALTSASGQPVNIRDQQERIADFHERNPGAAKRKSEVISAHEGKGEMTVDDFFSGTTAVFPGKLLISNSVSGFMGIISTGQADSEILLISDDAVFYRVNDEIFRCAISGGQLGKPVRLAHGGEFFQVHWAFLGKAEE